jgi:hypothetical protein
MNSPERTAANPDKAKRQAAYCQEKDSPVEDRNARWQARWTIDVGHGSVVGLTTDGGCFVVLYRHGETWRPGIHVPLVVAKRMSELVEYALY